MRLLISIAFLGGLLVFVIRRWRVSLARVRELEENWPNEVRLQLLDGGYLIAKVPKPGARSSAPKASRGTANGRSRSSLARAAAYLRRLARNGTKASSGTSTGSGKSPPSSAIRDF